MNTPACAVLVMIKRAVAKIGPPDIRMITTPLLRWADSNRSVSKAYREVKWRSLLQWRSDLRCGVDGIMEDAAHRAMKYLNSLAHRSVVPEPLDIAALAKLDGPLPQAPMDPKRVLALL